DFIRDPSAVIKSGDARGQKLFAQYKTVMPAFPHYSAAELDQIIAYLHTQASPAKRAGDSPAVASLKDPIPQPIQKSDLVVGVEFVTAVPATSDKGMRTRITKLGFIPGTERL